MQGLRWAEGYGRIEALGTEDDGARGATEIDRSFALVHGELPLPGTPAQLDVRAYPADPADSGLGLTGATVPGPLGDYPAWLGAADGPTWAIVVHGNSLSPADGLRMVPILTEAGLPDPRGDLPQRPGRAGGPERQAALRPHRVAGPRGDGALRARAGIRRRGARRLLDGRRHRDGLPAALRPRERGARGDPRRPDARLLDDGRRQRLARDAARARGSPAVVAHRRREVDGRPPLRRGLAGARLPRRHEPLRHGASSSSTAPPTRPCRSARAGGSQQLLPEPRRLVECPGAEHIGCWNLDPEAYAAAVQGFLASVG